jgi:uncharacterized membrane protein
MNKLLHFIDKVKSANGPAQIVGYSIWGVVLAGMLWDFDPDYLNQDLLFVWGVISFCVLPVAIWLKKSVLQAVLVVDMMLSAIVLSYYMMYDPEYATQMIYRVDNSGNYWKVEQDISCIFTQIALLWSVIHSAYLANLIQRQSLESRRFHNGL